MGLIKSKLNTLLTTMIIIILIGLIVITIYFQNSIKDANERFEIKSEQLELVKSELQYQINLFKNLNQTYEGLSQDLESYTSEFETVFGSCEEEKNLINQQLLSTIKELEMRETLLSSTKIDLERNRDSISSLNRDSISLQSYIETSESRINNLLKEIDDEYSSDITIEECKLLIRDLEKKAENTEKSIKESKTIIQKMKEEIDMVFNSLNSRVTLLRRY